MALDSSAMRGTLIKFIFICNGSRNGQRCQVPGERHVLPARPYRGATGSRLTLEISTFNAKIECKRHLRCVHFCVSGLLVSDDNKVSTILAPGQNFSY